MMCKWNLKCIYLCIYIVINIINELDKFNLKFYNNFEKDYVWYG